MIVSPGGDFDRLRGGETGEPRGAGGLQVRLERRDALAARGQDDVTHGLEAVRRAHREAELALDPHDELGDSQGVEAEIARELGVVRADRGAGNRGEMIEHLLADG